MNKQADTIDTEKIAILLPSLLGGGTERSVLTLAKGLKSKIKEIHLLALEKGVDYEIEQGLVFHYLSPFDGRQSNNNSILYKNLYYPKQIYNLIKYLKRNNIRTVLSFLERANFLNIFTNKFYRHRIITNTRTTLSKNYGVHFNALKRMMSHTMFKYYLPKSDLILCNSKGIKYDLEKSFHINPEEIKVIYNSYDIDKIKTLSTEPLEPEYRGIFDSPVIINVGRLTTPKGQWHLIRSFKNVKEKINHAKLVILGDGDYEIRLKQLVHDMALVNDVHFLGFQKNPYKFLSKAKIFVLSSIWEGFPNVIAEAMICGTPIISSDCRSGPREILAPDTDVSRETDIIEYAKYGILVPTPDGKLTAHDTQLTKEEMLMADAMMTLLSDEKLRSDYRARIASRIVDFDQTKIVQQYLNTIVLMQKNGSGVKI